MPQFTCKNRRDIPYSNGEAKQQESADRQSRHITQLVRNLTRKRVVSEEIETSKLRALTKPLALPPPHDQMIGPAPHQPRRARSTCTGAACSQRIKYQRYIKHRLDSMICSSLNHVIQTNIVPSDLHVGPDTDASLVCSDRRRWMRAARKHVVKRSRPVRTVTSTKISLCYNEAVRQRRDYKEKPKEAKDLIVVLYFDKLHWQLCAAWNGGHGAILHLGPLQVSSVLLQGHGTSEFFFKIKINFGYLEPRNVFFNNINKHFLG